MITIQRGPRHVHEFPDFGHCAVGAAEHDLVTGIDQLEDGFSVLRYRPAS
jgi:hypothetical protein